MPFAPPARGSTQITKAISDDASPAPPARGSTAGFALDECGGALAPPLRGSSPQISGLIAQPAPLPRPRGDQPRNDGRSWTGRVFAPPARGSTFGIRHHPACPACAGINQTDCRQESFAPPSRGSTLWELATDLCPARAGINHRDYHHCPHPHLCPALAGINQDGPRCRTSPTSPAATRTPPTCDA